MMNDYDYFINQLNLLIGFLDVSEEEVYNQIKHHDQFNLGITIEQLYDNEYTNFSNHITTSALLLGFAHLEDFLTKCIVKFLVAFPSKNEYKLTVKTMQEKGDLLVLYLAEEQSKRLTFAEKITFIEKNVGSIDSQIILDIRFMNSVRNCIMHNNGIADNRVASKFKEGQKIMFTTSELNIFGLKARQFANELHTSF